MKTTIKEFIARIYVREGSFAIEEARDRCLEQFDKWQSDHALAKILGSQFGKTGDFRTMDYAEGRHMYYIWVMCQE